MPKKAQAIALEPLGREYLKLQTRERAASKKYEAIKAERKALESKILSALRASKLDRFGVRGMHFAPSYQRILELPDFEAAFKWIVKNDASDMIRKQLNIEATYARLDAGIEIPGVRPGEIEKLSVRSAK